MNIHITYTSTQLFDGKYSDMALDQDASKAKWEEVLFDAIANEAANHMRVEASLVIMEVPAGWQGAVKIDNNETHNDCAWIRDIEYVTWCAGEWAVVA